MEILFNFQYVYSASIDYWPTLPAISNISIPRVPNLRHVAQIFTRLAKGAMWTDAFPQYLGLAIENNIFTYWSSFFFFQIFSSSYSVFRWSWNENTNLSCEYFLVSLWSTCTPMRHNSSRFATASMASVAGVANLGSWKWFLDLCPGSSSCYKWDEGVVTFPLGKDLKNMKFIELLWSFLCYCAVIYC